MKFNELLKIAKESKLLNDKSVGYLAINLNEVYGKNVISGLHIDTQKIKDGVDVKIVVDEGVKIKKDIHLCFGVTGEKALQKINMNIVANNNSKISILAHCLFPNSIKVKHIMKVKIKIKDNASFSYKEEHFHGFQNGAEVYLKAAVVLGRKSNFKNIFKLTKGVVGKLNVNYNITSKEESVSEMMSKVSGQGNDIIEIKEVNNLIGEKSKGLLNSKIAVRGKAKAEVYNIMKASAPYARGHIDCKEIVQENGSAVSIPIVKVINPKARITHEAAIGSIDVKQLETLMARGIKKSEAIKSIIDGLMN